MAIVFVRNTNQNLRPGLFERGDLFGREVEMDELHRRSLAFRGGAVGIGFRPGHDALAANLNEHGVLDPAKAAENGLAPHLVVNYDRDRLLTGGQVNYEAWRNQSLSGASLAYLR